jgi:Trk K+ transport system NAD-binding subunit
MHRHIIIWGDDGLADRLAEQVAATGTAFTCICTSADSRLGRKAVALGGTLVISDEVDAEALRAANLRNAAAVALVADNDVGVLAAGLEVARRAPGTPLLMRMFRSDLAAQVQTLTHATVLSSSEIATPELLAMAVSSDDVPVSARQARQAIRASTGPRSLRSRLASPLTRAIVAGVLLLASLGVSSWVYRRTLGLSWVDSVATTLSLSFGNLDVEQASDWVKVVGMLTLLVGGFCVAFLFTALHDRVTRRWVERTLGRAQLPRRNHVVVCGAGKIGSRLLETLNDQGVEAVAIDMSPQAPGFTVARRDGIAFREGSATDTELLEQLNLHSARALLAVTDSDMANLECALLARTINPNLRVIVRAFDARLADQLDDALSIHRTVSVHNLAAPVFARTLRAQVAARQQQLCLLPDEHRPAGAAQ